jgi:protein gp37
LAETRLRGRCGYDADEPFKVTVHPERFNEPFKWRKPKAIFVCSMGDLFHQEVTDDVIEMVMDIAGENSQHIYFFLTKRPERMVEFVTKHYDVIPYFYLGVTVENMFLMPRIDTLLQLSARWKRFISVEPMLSAVPIPMDVIGKLDWVICGGEKATNARECNEFWVHDLYTQCLAQRVPFFAKQPGDNFIGKWEPFAECKMMPWNKINYE